MIQGFVFKNYASFKEEQHFSMLAAQIKERFSNDKLNIAQPIKGVELLKSSVVYGANASGKSNFLNAFSEFKRLVFNIALEGFENKGTHLLNLNRYLLDDKSTNEPLLFEMCFVIEGVIYRYGFELDESGILEEWLYRKIKREAQVYFRSKNEAEISAGFKVIKEVWKKKMVRKDVLLLSVAAQFNSPIANKILNFIKGISIISGINNSTFKSESVKFLDDRVGEDIVNIQDMIKMADFGIEHLGTKNIKKSDSELRKFELDDLMTKRKKYDEDGQMTGFVEMPFDIYESEGTKKFFHLLGPVIQTLKKGSVLIVDELDTQLHPLLIRQVVRMFRNTRTNPNNAQLIFATHNVNLLEAELFRRDQIWFAEKDRYGASSIFALTDFKKGVRNDEKISKRYLEGRYGAIPHLQSMIEYIDKKE